VWHQGGGSGGDGDTFTMEGGEISGNTASSGGGVFNYNSGTLTKTSGVIYGSESGSMANTVLGGNGHAVYSIVNDVTRTRDSTAGTDVNLDGGTAANWE
jgi:hypothetical protein